MITELVPLESVIALNVLGGDTNVNLGRALRVHVLDDDGVGMVSQRVDVTVKNVLVLDPTGTLDCNTATQKLLANTVEGDNIREACAPHLSASPPVPPSVLPEDIVPGPAYAHSNYTDELGMVIFRTLEARRGPPGLFQLNVSATSGGATADKVVEVEVTTNVSQILINEDGQVGMAPYTVEVGQPVRTRTGAVPVVYVKDGALSPVEGRTVVAFAHHSDNFFRRDRYLDNAQEAQYHYNVGSGQKETVSPVWFGVGGCHMSSAIMMTPSGVRRINSASILLRTHKRFLPAAPFLCRRTNVLLLPAFPPSFACATCQNRSCPARYR